MNLAQRLERELLQCHAPVTGYFVACALTTQKAVYFGHNYEEENPTIFRHAETMAITKMLQAEVSPKITAITMYGGGNVKKMKYYIPCFSCTQELAPYKTSENISIDLLPLTGTDRSLSVTFKELSASYSDLPYSKLKTENRAGLIDELEQKTILKEQDLHFIANLALTGLHHEIEFYLTGSSTGRGAVSTLIISKKGEDYRDLDVIAVSNKNPKEVEILLESLITLHYGDFRKEIRKVPAHQNTIGVVVLKSFYHHTPEKNGLIDFTLTTDFKGSFHYRPYELKNWFHQLS